MTPSERWKWAQKARLNAKMAVLDAIEAAEEAEMEYHYAQFLYVSASIECPTCGATPGAYCAIWQDESGDYSSGNTRPSDGLLVALFLHPARTTTQEALAASAATT